MEWINTATELPPKNKIVLVKYIQLGDWQEPAYEVLQFRDDEEYGFCAASHESYVSIGSIEKWCLINP